MNFPDKLIPKQFYLPLRLFLNKLRGRIEIDVQFIKKVVPPKSIVVDVGAHKGLYSLPLYGMGCSVYAFEPNAHCAELLKGWAVGKKRVQVFNMGLSDVSGTADLKIPIDETGRKHIASASVCKDFEGTFAIERINLGRLDEFNLPGLSFLKIDVEGLEDKVIRGAIKTICKYRPIMLIEIEERHRSAPVTVIFNLIYGMGYRAFQRLDTGFQEVLLDDITDFVKLSKKNKLSKNFWFIHSEADSSIFSEAVAG